MENSPDTKADPQPDWMLMLPADVFYEIVRVFRGALPLPDVGAVGWERRDRAAIAAAAAFRPVDASEANLAAQIVMAEAWSAECLRLSGERARAFGEAVKCRAQALGLMREAKNARRLMANTQARRVAMEQDETALGRAEMVEYATVGLMKNALSELPVAPAEVSVTEDAPAVDGIVTTRTDNAGGSDRVKIIADPVPKTGLDAPAEINSGETITETRTRPRAYEEHVQGIKGTTVPLRGLGQRPNLP